MAEAERFCMDSNPPNAVLNKNEIDKAWRGHATNSNIRQTGDLSACAQKYQETLSVHTH